MRNARLMFPSSVVLAGLLPGSTAVAQVSYNLESREQRRPATSLRIDLIGDSTQTDNAGYRRDLCANLTASRLQFDERPQAATVPATKELAVRVYRGEPFKIVLVGDSTVAPGGGWGPGFCALLTPNVTCVDDALNGRSSKSFLDEGSWTKALGEHGQYYFIQFGHNDQKDDPARHTDPDTTYAKNLRHYIRDVRSSGAIPIVVSPLSRRNYKDGVLVNDGLEAYAAAAHRVAEQEQVAFVDLFSLSRALLREISQEQADSFDATSHPDAKAESSGANKPDRTHLNEKGKAVFGRMVAENVVRMQVELGPNVKVSPAALGAAPPQHGAPTDGK